MAYRHIPVMRSEVLEYLNCRPGKIFVDGTLGGAGHARDICERIMPGGLLIGIDQDPAAIANAGIVLEPFAARVRLVHENFAQLPHVLSQLGITGVDGILLDLGLSLNQLENSGRGFSFQREEPLDMRMDPRAPETAADLVNGLAEDELRRIFQEYGEEHFSGRIARVIAAERRRAPVQTSGELARLVCAAVPGRTSGRSRIHPATRVFMALRIAVNRELERLEEFLDQVPHCLNREGRLCILAFHSLEDRIVKHRLRALAQGRQPESPFATNRERVPGALKVLTKKVLRPGPEEIAANPMARSTRLRAAERV
jgi:16S rRNA (cytosine1402-N4)-methyltransferase